MAGAGDVPSQHEHMYIWVFPTALNTTTRTCVKKTCTNTQIDYQVIIIGCIHITFVKYAQYVSIYIYLYNIFVFIYLIYLFIYIYLLLYVQHVYYSNPSRGTVSLTGGYLDRPGAHSASLAEAFPPGGRLQIWKTP